MTRSPTYALPALTCINLYLSSKKIMINPFIVPLWIKFTTFYLLFSNFYTTNAIFNHKQNKKYEESGTHVKSNNEMRINTTLVNPTYIIMNCFFAHIDPINTEHGARIHYLVTTCYVDIPILDFKSKPFKSMLSTKVLDPLHFDVDSDLQIHFRE